MSVPRPESSVLCWGRQIAVFSLVFLLCGSGSSQTRQRDYHHDDIICLFYFPLASSHHLVSPDLVLLLLTLPEVIPSPNLCDPNLGIILLLISSYSFAGMI